MVGRDWRRSAIFMFHLRRLLLVLNTTHDSDVDMSPMITRLIFVLIFLVAASSANKLVPTRPRAAVATDQKGLRVKEDMIAKNLFDVVATTASSTLVVGGVGFFWRGCLRFKGPAAGWQAAQRWGRISGGFSGGRALGQVIRGRDGMFAAVVSAVAGGACAANSIAEMQTTIPSFVIFSLLLERMPAATKEPEGEGPVQHVNRRELAYEKARREFAERHKDDPTRLKALQSS